jgi:hypothetical protein
MEAIKIHNLLNPDSPFQPDYNMLANTEPLPDPQTIEEYNSL